MIDIKKVSKQVASNLNMDRDLVEKICQFPFLFTVEVMKDETDTHNILFNKLFAFKLKPRFKDNKHL